MADVQRIYWDAEGYAHTACLHWEGFLKILWDTLRIFHYRYPPQYKGRELLRLESLDVVLLLLFPNILSLGGNLLR
jgi:hypothetical protein